MTPKEKAAKLVGKYIIYTPAEVAYEYQYAKKCALIAVDEILKVVYGLPVYVSVRLYKKYWKEVKTEIENL